MPFTGTGSGIQNANDVFFSGVSANQILRYNTSTSKWNNATISKSDVGLANVSNTSDASKPISTATQTALDTKVASTSIDTIVTLSQAAYDALGTKDSRTFYVVT